MAAINLTPENKTKLSRSFDFQTIFRQAVLEYAREEAEDIFAGGGVGDLREWKWDTEYRNILRQGDLTNIQGKVNSFLVPFTDQQSIDIDNVAATITAIKANLPNWVLILANINPGDQNIIGTKNSQTGEFIPDTP